MNRLAVVFLFCIFSSSAFAETNTTDNLLPEISNFSTSGGNEGFELNYGLTTVSHPSDADSVVEKFEHDVELDFGGARNFTFQSGVTASSHGVLTGQYEFFAIDAGFPSGFFGPQISNPHLSITHTLVSVIEQDRDALDNPILKGK